MEKDVLTCVLYNNKKYIVILLIVHDKLYTVNQKKTFYLLPIEDEEFLNQNCIIDEDNKRITAIGSKDYRDLTVVETPLKDNSGTIKFLNDNIHVYSFSGIKRIDDNGK